MQYVLAMSFEFLRYRGNATVRIYADDRLVDEMSLNESIKLKIIDTSDPILERIHGPKNYCDIQIVPKKLFLFEIDEKFLHSHIVIEVLNDHSNYTNGFMSKYSYVRFHFVYLIPSCFMELKNWKMLDRFRGADDPFYVWPRIPFDSTSFVYTNNKQDDPYFFFNERGGNFAIRIPLGRKHNVIHFGKHAQGRIQVSMRFARILDAFGTLNKST